MDKAPELFCSVRTVGGNHGTDGPQVKSPACFLATGYCSLPLAPAGSLACEHSGVAYVGRQDHAKAYISLPR